MRKVAFYTLGCKVNQYETEAMRQLFVSGGDLIVEYNDFADVYVINTCTVTGMSDKKSRQMIRKFKRQNPQAVIAVVGCYSQIAPKEVMNIEGVNLVLGTQHRKEIVALLENITAVDQKERVSDIMKIREYEEMEVNTIEGRTRAFVKVQDGCDRYCSYCIIPYARGPVRSREKEKIIAEIKRLSSRGYKEVVLTGIHVASYGKDLKNIGLTDLLMDIDDLESLKRIRLSSIEPVLMTEQFLNILSKMDKICPHFHLSLQSGCDTVLSRMNRRYTTKEYFEAVERIRSYWPNAAITTDVIVGFPGETEEEFEQTYQFVQKVRFSQLHVFGFSPREGTPAATMKNQIVPEIKQQRVEKLIALGKRGEENYLRWFKGKKVNIIIEDSDGNARYQEGLTENYLRVLVPNKGYSVGTEIDTMIYDSDDKALYGMPWPELL